MVGLFLCSTLSGTEAPDSSSDPKLFPHFTCNKPLKKGVIASDFAEQLAPTDVPVVPVGPLVPVGPVKSYLE